jgi:outer membrane protein assembly factor BamC
VNPFFKLTLVSVAISLSACTILETDKVDYRSASNGVKVPSLDVPPDLTQLSKDSHYTVLGGAVSASGFKAGQPAVSTTPVVAAIAMGDVRIERAGNQRWLVVNRPADKLWEPVKEFWQENGFLLAMDQNTLGIMETDWAENRAKIPQDFIRSTLGKAFDSLYSTAERDKFRTRLERNANGDTEIFISHRGVIETLVSKSGDSAGNTIWQPRPVDPELEAEFLRRLMVKLGVSEPQAKTLVASSNAPKSIASVSTESGQPTVRIEEGFESAWRRVGLALDRTGFTVEDRDRKQGIYFVRYVPLNADNTEPGFFSKLFSSSKGNDAAKLQIAVRSTANVTTVSVLDAKGSPEALVNAQRIVKVIADDIK